MEEFLPGLIKIMEERLGRFGRSITTAVVICVVLGIVAWALKLFWDNIVFPVYLFIKATGEATSPEQFLKEIATPFGVYVLICIMFYILFLIVVNYTILRPFERRVDKVKGYVSETEKFVENALSELDRIADEKKQQIDNKPDSN